MRSLRLSGLVLLLALAPAQSRAEWTLNAVYGPRYLDHPLWESIDGDEAFGIDVTWGKKDWPVRIAFGIADAGDSNEDECPPPGYLSYCPPEAIGSILERSIFEFSTGISRYWIPAKRLELYAGAGVSSVYSSVESGPNGPVDDDTSAALYGQLGALWLIPLPSERGFLHVGFDLRVITGTDFYLLGADVDADYYQIGLVFGGGRKPRPVP